MFRKLKNDENKMSIINDWLRNTRLGQFVDLLSFIWHVIGLIVTLILTIHYLFVTSEFGKGFLTLFIFTVLFSIAGVLAKQSDQ